MLDILCTTLLSNSYPINLQDSSLSMYRVENIVDPEHLASQKQADLDLYCFQNGTYQVYHGMGLKVDTQFWDRSDWRSSQMKVLSYW